jgi:uncharacterized protein (TIGR02594 family)
LNKFLIVALAIVGACTSPSADIRIEEDENRTRIYLDTSNPGYKAAQYLNFTERTHRTELQELTGVDPVRTEWCAAFVNAVLEKDGIPNLNDQTEYPPLMARSFLYWGEKVLKSEIKRGDVVIFPRGNQGWQGHVGFFVEEQNGYWVILGGNQDQSVNYQLFDPRRAIAVRRWVDSVESAWLLGI